ncbi:MbtH family protein [Agrobacterium tumefaciens]|uniref:MbtH family protein n=1 Tax=Agrobacterium tumefaciens TaxID=358 RepID=UPI0009BDB284
MPSPFESEGQFLVLKNEVLQHSLWPSFVEVPAGWSIVHGPTSKAECVNYIEENWKDIRPMRRMN